MGLMYRQCKKCRQRKETSLLVDKVCSECRKVSLSKEELSNKPEDSRDGSTDTVIGTESPVSKRVVHFYEWDKHTPECTKCVDNSLVMNRMEERIIKLEGLIVGLMELVGKIHNDIEISKSSE